MKKSENALIMNRKKICPSVNAKNVAPIAAGKQISRVEPSNTSIKNRRTTLDCNGSLDVKKRFENLDHTFVKLTSKSYSKSIDIIDKSKMKSTLTLEINLDHYSKSERQRSIDYPYIVRKTPNLSDVVRKRLLFQKVTRNALLLGESISSSTEKEHIPKAVRRIIIRQDNSIEVSLSKPPKIRKQTMSEDFAEKTVDTTSCLKTSQNNGLSVSASSNDRRKTIETCENIFLQSEATTKLRVKTPPSNPHRILLYRDKTDKSIKSISDLVWIFYSLNKIIFYWQFQK